VPDAAVAGSPFCPAMEIELLGKPGCHLCDGTEPVVQNVCGELSLRYDVVNIEDHQGLFDHHKKDETPILMLDGKKLFKHRIIDEKPLRDSLRRHLKFSQWP
jgi:hypothetical protein